MTEVAIPQNEKGVTRIFATGLPDVAGDVTITAGKTTPSKDFIVAQSSRLGAMTFNSQHAELIRPKDMASKSVKEYLLSKGAARESVEADAEKLAGLSGWLLLASSEAFMGRAQTLQPE
ncbi:MAG: hypothetical protein AAF330_06895, partial [Pseudomonadota bacterium]